MTQVLVPLDCAALVGLARAVATTRRLASGATVLRARGVASGQSPADLALGLVQHLAPRPAQQEVRAFHRNLGQVQAVPLAAGPQGGVDRACVAGCLAHGGTVVLQKVDALDFGWHRLARAFEGLTGQPAQVNIYATTRGTDGLAWHRDPHDVLAVQLAGTKLFSLARDLRQGSPVDPEVLSLTPGDLLWMPRGTPHAACSAQDGSVHASLGLLHLGPGPDGMLCRVTRTLGATSSPGSLGLLPHPLLAETLRFLLAWRPLRPLPAGLDRGALLRPDLLALVAGDSLLAGGPAWPCDAALWRQLEQGRLAGPDGARGLPLGGALRPARDLADLLQATAGLSAVSKDYQDA